MSDNKGFSYEERQAIPVIRKMRRPHPEYAFTDDMKVYLEPRMSTLIKGGVTVHMYIKTLTQTASRKWRTEWRWLAEVPVIHLQPVADDDKRRQIITACADTAAVIIDFNWRWRNKNTRDSLVMDTRWRRS